MTAKLFHLRRNFLGEKINRRVTMLEGVDIEISKNMKDELTLTGNSLEKVSQSAADIQQVCRVKNKDIRKVRAYDMSLVSSYTDFAVFGWPLRVGEGKHRGGEGIGEACSMGGHSREGIQIGRSYTTLRDQFIYSVPSR